jgi:argininosuccinate synthase
MLNRKKSRLLKPAKKRELVPMHATMEADPTKAYNQDAATGFIRLNALRLKVAAKVYGKKK